jgi:hypothetical protein
MRVAKFILFPALAGLVLMVGCLNNTGGGSGTSRLAYTDPPATPGTFRFVRNPDLSTDAHLVLDLVGPGALTGRGLDFTVTAGAGPATWAKVAPDDGRYMENLVFNLGTGVQLFETLVQGQSLLAGAFQKGQGNSVPLAGTLGRIALDLAPGSAGPAGIALQVDQFQVLPDTGSALQTAPCLVGTLVAQ